MLYASLNLISLTSYQFSLNKVAADVSLNTYVTFLVEARIKSNLSIGVFAQLKQLLANKVAGSYDSVAVNQLIDAYITDNSCVMFSFSSCPYCLKAKSILIDQLGATVKVVRNPNLLILLHYKGYH